MTRDQTASHQRALDARQPDLRVLMDAVTKPHNVSAIIRSADAVGIQQVHTTSTGELARRNYMNLGGAKHWVAVTTHRSTRAALTALRADGWRLVAAYSGEKSRDYRDVDYTQKVAIMVGGEHVAGRGRGTASQHQQVGVLLLVGHGHLEQRPEGGRGVVGREAHRELERGAARNLRLARRHVEGG